jgi:hypothetical protein
LEAFRSQKIPKISVFEGMSNLGCHIKTAILSIAFLFLLIAIIIIAFATLSFYIVIIFGTILYLFSNG